MMMMAIIKEQWRRVPPATCGPPKLHRKNNCRIQIILVNIKFCMKTLAKVQNKSASLCQNAYILYSNFRFFGFLYHHWNSSGSDHLWKVCLVFCFKKTLAKGQPRKTFLNNFFNQKLRITFDFPF